MNCVCFLFHDSLIRANFLGTISWYCDVFNLFVFVYLYFFVPIPRYLIIGCMGGIMCARFRCHEIV